MDKYKVTMDPPVLTLTPSGKTNNPTLKKIQTVTFNHFLTPVIRYNFRKN